VEVGYCGTPDFAYGVYVSGSYAYVADWDAGLRVISVTDPANPVEVGYYDTPSYAEGVYVSGSYAYVADGDAGLIILQYTNPNGIGDDSGNSTPLPRSFALLQNYPNPFNPVTTIRVEVPAGETFRSSLVVYDLRGRRVRTLLDGPLGPGNHLFTWDGRDDRGEDVPSGVYIYRVSRADRVLSRKMLLMK
jgi:hypothetical protein